MPVFGPGELRTARYSLTNPSPAAIVCDVEIYLDSQGGLSESALCIQANSISPQNYYDFIMPSELGTYHMRIKACGKEIPIEPIGAGEVTIAVAVADIDIGWLVWDHVLPLGKLASGIENIAHVRMTNNTSNTWTYDAELYLVKDGFNPWVYDVDNDGLISMSESLKAINEWHYGPLTEAQAMLVVDLWKNAIAKPRVSFTLEAGASQTIDFPMTMPSYAGTYKVHLDVYVAGELIVTHVATVVIIGQIALASGYNEVIYTGTEQTVNDAFASIAGYVVKVLHFTDSTTEYICGNPVGCTKMIIPGGKYRIGVTRDCVWTF